jgi:type IV secretion system protein VirB4
MLQGHERTMTNLPGFVVEQFEIDRDKFVPYAGHITPDTVMLTDGSIMAMLKLDGTPFELETPSVRNARADRINTLLRTLGDSDLTVCFHLVRHKHAPPAPQPVSQNAFVRTLMADYSALAVRDLFVNEWFVSAVVAPPKKLRRWLPARRRKTALVASEQQLRRLENVVYLIQSTLSDYQPKRLGTIEVDGLPVTEIGTALHLIRTAIFELVPHTTGLLSSAIYREPMVAGPLAFMLNKPAVSRYGSMIGFNNYPALPRVGMFNSLLSAPYCLVMSHSFRFRSIGAAVSAMRLVRQQMENAGDAATYLAEGLEEAANKTASLKEATGRHHFSLAVYAETLPDLDMNVAHATAKLSNPGGAAPIREMSLWYNGAQESVYYSQLPGTQIFRPRPGDISTRDLAAMASLDAYPRGAAQGYWGPSPIRFKTNGGTAYDFVPQDEDVGHALVIGRIGSGKTVLLGTMAAALEPVMGDNGIRLVIDKDEANRLLIEAAGGTYRPLRRNEASGLAPLVAYEDTTRNRSFFHSLYTWLIGLDGRRGLTRDEDGRLMRGIVRQLQMPPEQRSMGGIREYLGYRDPESGAGARFERWCAGGTMGWLLDNREHVINVGPGLYGFDFTDLIPREGTTDDGSCQAAAAVIVHQLAGLMDGRRIAAFFDECRFYMEPLRAMIEDYTLTGRKKELMCWLVAQQPEHFTESAIGMSLVSQMRTKIVFPDASHSGLALQKLQISAAAINMLKTDMTLGNARRFLLWRPNAPVICEFDLTGLSHLPILAGRAGTIGLMARVRAEVPQDEVLPEFYRRLANTQRRAA